MHFTVRQGDSTMHHIFLFTSQAREAASVIQALGSAGTVGAAGVAAAAGAAALASGILCGGVCRFSYTILPLYTLYIIFIVWFISLRDIPSSTGASVMGGPSAVVVAEAVVVIRHLLQINPQLHHRVIASVVCVLLVTEPSAQSWLLFEFISCRWSCSTKLVFPRHAPPLFGSLGSTGTILYSAVHKHTSYRITNQGLVFFRSYLPRGAPDALRRLLIDFKDEVWINLPMQTAPFHIILLYIAV